VTDRNQRSQGPREDPEDQYDEDLDTESSMPRPLPGLAVARAAPADERARLVILQGQGAGWTCVVAEQTLIGRAPEAQVQLSDDSVSRRHALILRSGLGIFTLQDLGSRNGTLVNGAAITQHTLTFGDRIQIGANTTLLFAQRDEAEERLLQSQKMESIGRLASGVAHDFGNLLCTILGYTELIRTLEISSEVEDALKAIHAAAERGVELTGELLRFARGGLDEKRPVDVAALLEEVKLLVARTFSPKLSVTFAVDRGLSVLGARSRLHQVLMNLCINARDAMPNGGRLTLRAARRIVGETDPGGLAPGPYVVISVEDTGHGMSPETLGRIFEPFFTTKSAGKGTGMGLAVVYGIVRDHGGRIEAESRPGAGSTFQVYLPSAEVTVRQEQTARMAMPRLVLVVFADARASAAARRMLEAQELGVITAATGAEALESFEQSPNLFEIVLLDLGLPDDPVAIVHALRRMRKSVKVVVYASAATAARVPALLAAGADASLEWPFHEQDLSGVIGRWVRPAR
jgi:two-component system, cell cycle sensor histidine kinase and response regulator CckA